MHKTVLRTVALVAVMAGSLALSAVAQQGTTTDIGTADKATLDKAHPAQPPYSPYAGRHFPTRPSTCAIPPSVSGSQKVMSMPRYLPIASASAARVYSC